MSYDPLYYPYASRRMTTYARNGMVATSQPLAAQAGLDALKQGGNAIDAAIAAAAALTVVEPTSNGIGGDAFALVWMNGKLHGLNSSGPAPKLISAAQLQKLGYSEMPRLGFLPVTVPGAPAAWAELSQRFGKLPLSQVLAPAVDYAENGYPVSPNLGRLWESSYRLYRDNCQGNEFASWFSTYAPNGRAPRIGEMWRSPDHASTLKEIAETKARAFYEGAIADKIEAFSKEYGGYLRKDDLAEFAPQWVEPIRVSYRGYDVWEIPPNGQGIVALMALNLLKGFDLCERDSVETYHRQIDAIKLAFADAKKFVTDPKHMQVRVEDLLSDGYADDRRRLIGNQALTPEPGRPPGGGTVYLATADSEGNMVSYIQSNYNGFGSGLVVPGTGISLHNRGYTFSLDPSHANFLEPGKKTYHTIIPGFLTKDGSAVGPFGVMGAYMQPQGHVQVVTNSIDFQLNPQAALDAPRWQWTEGKRVVLESSVPGHIAEALARRGHDIQIAVDSVSFGRGQIIRREESGVLAGGTEPRTDGGIAAW
ncbi:gamma-glutamyltransferase family protein [Alicyclobacillus tolerans]|uniref:gamma-glutamyltransferase family protein n=1 Tax=Alicyclobacillus tolerans TaxID=90970 RepID=UPI001F3A50BA|nr:gamma-glutamyltransferase family protein [Alicyclobacillus tolerans]MCF8566451.1 gamma-glutamyltransferase family protein [Alicyclobacillus tolerans]